MKVQISTDGQNWTDITSSVNEVSVFPTGPLPKQALDGSYELEVRIELKGHFYMGQQMTDDQAAFVQECLTTGRQLVEERKPKFNGADLCDVLDLIVTYINWLDAEGIEPAAVNDPKELLHIAMHYAFALGLGMSVQDELR